MTSGLSLVMADGVDTKTRECLACLSGGSCSCMPWLQFHLRHLQDDVSPNSTEEPRNINNLSPYCWPSVSRLYTSDPSYPGHDTLASMTQQHQRTERGGKTRRQYRVSAVLTCTVVLWDQCCQHDNSLTTISLTCWCLRLKCWPS